MFLRSLLSTRQSDRGSALIGVIALLGVTGVIAVTVGTVSVNSLQTTNGVAASVEARGAAEAGINAAELALRTPPGCPATGVVTKTTAPAYSVQIQHNIGAGWVDGCPPNNATQVRFLSTGFADRATFGASDLGGERLMEAVYQYIPESVPIPQIDPAVYAYSIDGVLKKFVLDSADLTIAADVQIKTGDFECSNNAQVSGDVILADGTAKLTSCRILGTVHSTGWVTLQNGSFVRDDVIAGGSELTPTGVASIPAGKAVFVEDSSDIGGSVFAGGDILVDENGTTVTGNVTAASSTATNVTIGTGARVDGSVFSSGTLTLNGSLEGTPSTAVNGLEVPPVPLVPNWTNIPWTPIAEAQLPSTTWGQEGFTRLFTWSGTCNFAGNDPRWAALDDLDEKIVIDATACVGGVTTQSSLAPELFLQDDVVIIADSFIMDKLYMRSSSSTENRKLYLIVPDNDADPIPSCEGEAGNIYMNSENNISPNLSIFLYSPCEIQSDRNGLRGQMYGGIIDFDQQAQMTYVPTSPPGIDLTGAGTPPPPTPPRLGERIGIREVSSGG